MGGTLTKSRPVRADCQYAVACHGLERGLPGGGGSPSTLLGPETTGHAQARTCVSGSSTGHLVRVIPAHAGWSLDWPRCWVWCHGFAWWVRPLLENCIVDASIFEFFQDRSMMIDHEASAGWWVVGECVVLVSVIVVLLKFLRAHWWMPWH